MLKSLADEHPRVSLVVAGSHAHLMERLTGSTGAPLYGMAERISLGPVSGADMTSYLVQRSRVGAKPMSESVAALMIDRAGPVPNDIQRLAYAAFEVAESHIVVPDVETGLVRTASHDAAAYAETYQRLSGGQRRVLSALASGGPGSLFSADFARSVGLATGASVRRAIDALADQELLAQRDGTWTVSDPFLAAWLNQPGSS